jgi:hypothetical protein
MRAYTHPTRLTTYRSRVFLHNFRFHFRYRNEHTTDMMRSCITSSRQVYTLRFFSVLPPLILISLQHTSGDAWFRPNEAHITGGVALRVAEGEFRVFPYENLSLEPFETAVAALNPVVAVKVRSASVHAALSEMWVSFFFDFPDLLDCPPWGNAAIVCATTTTTPLDVGSKKNKRKLTCLTVLPRTRASTSMRTRRSRCWRPC